MSVQVAGWSDGGPMCREETTAGTTPWPTLAGLRTGVDGLQSAAPEFHHVGDEVHGLGRSAGSVNHDGSRAKNPRDNALTEGQAFDLVVIQLNRESAD